ncbi:MAG: type IV secretion system protein [Campylobacteraceae bacterium]|jgi:type IV secretion system protein VirB6|nr:type IV secretion system protein [Campylobacteraceae bacterium]
MASGIFSNIQSEVDAMVKALNEAMMSQRVEDLKSILVISITIYIVYKAYIIWAGKVQEPMKDLMWDFASKAVIIAFISSADTWLAMSIAAINDLHEWAGGGINLFADLDKQVSLSITIDNNFKSFNADSIYPFIITAKWIGLGLGLAVPFFIMMMAKISLQLLIITAPIFIFCRLFGFMKGMFDGWLRLIFTNILIVLFITLLIGSSMDFMSWLLKSLGKVTGNGSLMAFYIVIGGAFQAAIAKLAVNIAQGVASIKIEDLKIRDINSSSSSYNSNFKNSYNSNSANYFMNQTVTAMARNLFSKAGTTIEQTSKSIGQNTSKAFRQYKSNLFRHDK